MKRITKLLVVALVTSGGIYSLYSSHAQSELSELALANVDALATLTTKDCMPREGAFCYGLIYGAPKPTDDNNGPSLPPSITIEEAAGWANRAEVIN